MKRLFFIVLLFVGLLLPQSIQAAGKSKPHRHRAAKAVPCNQQKGRARKRCEARAAAIERARRLAAIRYEMGQQRIENQMRSASLASIAKDDTVGEDLAIRKIALDALGGKGGTVFVMETQTGKVRTVVNQDWAYRKSYIPCSTIKLVTSVAGLVDNVIDEDDDDQNPQTPTNFDRAIAKSNNNYFNQVGNKVGREKFVKTAQTLGLGQKTGINAEGETPGELPLVKKTGSSRQLYYSFGDGTKVTAPQLAVLASGLTNGGKKVKPFIPKPGQDANPQTTPIDIPQQTLKGVIPGMKGVTEFGTARLSGGSALGVAGKTGTCSDNISRIGLFTSVAPIENPRYTVVVIIRGRKSQTSGPAAARIAGKIYQGLLGPTNDEAANPQAPVAKSPSITKQQ